MGSTGVNIAQTSSNNSALANGTAGTYQLYRAGTVDVKNGFIFLSPDKVPASAIEIRQAGKWVPLKTFLKNWK